MTEHTATVIPFESDAQKAKAMLDLVGADDSTDAPVVEKLQDALTPGYQAEFDPAEAEQAGAFQEDALSEEDALATTEDTLNFAVPADPKKAGDK